MRYSKQLTGIAGEYYVAAELSRRGYIAAITLRNSDSTDILVSNIEGSKLISIQVKTTRNKSKWILNKRVEGERFKSKYYVFVSISDDLSQAPVYYIINSINLSERIYEGHKRWLTETGKNGRIRRDSEARQFDPKYFSQDELLDWDKFLSIINEN